MALRRRYVATGDSPAGEWEAFALVDDLTGSVDSREVLMAATRRFADMFGPWYVYTVLLSDGELQRWRVLGVGRPGTSEPFSPADALTPGTDLDALMVEFGDDVTAAFTDPSSPLRVALDPASPLFIADEENDPLLVQVRAVLPPLMEARSILAAGWTRPRGGRGCVLLGYEHRFEMGEAEQLLPRFAPCVRLVAQLALYPGYSSLVARLEQSAQAVRRNIVHDLKTPLTVIKGYADLLLMPSVSDTPELREEMATAIVEQSEEMLEDLRDLLVPLDEFWVPQLEVVDLSLLIKRAVMGERHTARAASHTFAVKGADVPVPAYVDRRKVRRMIENLLSNAVKYSPGENKTVTTALSVKENEAHLTFTDQGIGMTAEQLKAVLGGTGRVVDEDLGIEGTGFGLDSCRRVLTAHGGRLEAASEVGQGSTFTAVLPLGVSPT